MSRTKRSATLLLLAGVLAVIFFLLTDPALGSRYLYDGGQLRPVDAVHTARPGTIFGLIGSGGILGVGGYLMTRQVK